MICSDHPQTYSLPIRLFGRPRLPQPGQLGVSLFDLQARIGHSSPEIHAFFPRQLSVRRTLESAWADTFLSKPTLDDTKDSVVDACLRWFQADLNPSFADPLERDTDRAQGPPDGLSGRRIPHTRAQRRAAEEYRAVESDSSLSDELDWADHLYFGDIPFSAQRVALFLRAVIKQPALVILDEAFSGLDERLRDKCMLFLAHGETRILGYPQTGEGAEEANENIRSKPSGKKSVIITGLSEEQALLCVSHVKEEVPGQVREWLCLPEPNLRRPPRAGRFKVPLGDDRAQWHEIWSS